MRIVHPAELQGKGVGHGGPVVRMEPFGEGFEGHRTVLCRNPGIVEIPLVDDHRLLLEIIEPREYFGYAQGYIDHGFVGHLVYGIAVREHEMPPFQTGYSAGGKKGYFAVFCAKEGVLR